MADKSERWREAYEAARQESDPAKQLKLSKRARRLMQRRLVAMASTEGKVSERDEIEEALRTVWELEKRLGEHGKPGGWLQ